MSETVQLQGDVKQWIGRCMLSDQHRFRRQFSKLKTIKDNDQRVAKLDQLTCDVVQSVERRYQRQQNVPEIEYPDLPVTAEKQAIAEAIEKHQVVIIAGETGSGKTTQIPKICLELGRGVAGMIAHTQPRRLAARSVATRIAEELNTSIGDAVGFKVRFSDHVSDRSYIKLMTDGILLTEIQQDRFLNQYDTIIIDEAHERSLNIDFILGYLNQLLPKRPDLKVIITSATIDPERFSRHFNNAPILSISGRTYPVDILYRPIEDLPEGEREQTQGIIAAVEELSGYGQGDILVFLSGEREIRDTAEALRRQAFRHTEIVPLYARLSAGEQSRIFQPHSGRRIVLSTNVAETSLTVPGIKYVIDTGFVRISRYSARSKVQRLPIEPISQASAAQRSGRCGRVQEGICIRLYSEDDYLSRPEFTDPEILRTNLASVILQMLALKFGTIDQFPFVQAPEQRNINDGFRLLEEIGAIGNKRNAHGQAVMTDIGRKLSRLPIDPRYGRMIIEAGHYDSVAEVMVITAGLSIQDPRERPHEKRQAADACHEAYLDKDSDFISLFNLWNVFKDKQQALSQNQLRKWCKQNFINYLRMREWQDIVSQLKKSVVDVGLRLSNKDTDYDSIHKPIACGLLSHIGMKDKEADYLGARNSRFLVFPGSGLHKTKAKWIMGAELVETSRLFARTVAKIQPQWLEPLAQHLVKRSYSEPSWSKNQGAVIALEKVTLYGLAVVVNRRVNFSQIDSVVSRDLFIRHALVYGDTKLNHQVLMDNQALVNEVTNLESKSRRRDILVDEDEMVAFYQERLPQQVCSEPSFRKWIAKCDTSTLDGLRFEREALKRTGASKVSLAAHPDVWRHGDLTLPLSYHFEPKDIDDGVSVNVPLALLNQIHDIGFDWLIPGLRHELIVTLIKQLPKRLRRNFVPAPNYADACLSDMPSETANGQPIPFLDALSMKLKKMSGADVAVEEWRVDELPKHLRMNFKVRSDTGELVAQGRDLEALKQSLQKHVQKSIQAVAKPDIEQKGLKEWSFDRLDREYVEKRAGFEIKAYPGLVDNGTSVSIKLFDQPHIANESHAIGVRRLVLLAIPSPVKYLQEKLPNKAKLGLYFNPFGQVKALINDCISCGIDHLLGKNIDDIRDLKQFESQCELIRGEINDSVLTIAIQVEKGLTIAHSIKKSLKGNIPLEMINAHADIKLTLEQLVFPGFVSELSAARLKDWQRYLQALSKRIEKLKVDVSRDRIQQLSIQKVQAAFDDVLGKQPKGQPVPKELLETQWMIHELRVSLFAQQLGTAYPISEKRIMNHLKGFS